MLVGVGGGVLVGVGVGVLVGVGGGVLVGVGVGVLVGVGGGVLVGVGVAVLVGAGADSWFSPHATASDRSNTTQAQAAKTFINAPRVLDSYGVRIGRA